MANLSAAARALALHPNNDAAPEAADAAPAAGVAAAVGAASNHQNGGGDGAVAPAAAPNHAGAPPAPAARPRRYGGPIGRVSDSILNFSPSIVPHTLSSTGWRA